LAFSLSTPIIPISTFASWLVDMRK